MANKIIQYGKYVGLNLLFLFILHKLTLYVKILSSIIIPILTQLGSFFSKINLPGGLSIFLAGFFIGFIPAYLAISVIDKDWKLNKQKLIRILITTIIGTMIIAIGSIATYPNPFLVNLDELLIS